MDGLDDFDGGNNAASPPQPMGEDSSANSPGVILAILLVLVGLVCLAIILG
jgi:hypothetical protein